MHYNEATGEAIAWHWLMYADGPLEGRTRLFGWYAASEIPERVTATAGTILQTEARPVPGDPGRCHYLNYGVIATVGRPVRYQLEGDAYRFAGEGSWLWPGRELEASPEHDQEADDWHAEHEMMD